MCGIAGELAFPSADPERVRRMTAALAHRGPDGDGFHHEGPIALGHRRLAIIDLEGGAQPIFNEDGSVAVVFNGEIYNYRELAAELAPRHRLRTVSDTEVLVHLYEELGVGMLERLRGMFAFALWDQKANRLFAARDRFGKKPFLYAADGHRLSFASELGALAASGLDLGAIDRRALSDYLELLYVPAPLTLRTGVKKLPAGHYLLADDRGLRVERYWAPPEPGSAGPATRLGSAWRHETRKTLEEAVRLRLRSDVPIAALLSGGIDSSVVVALAARELGRGLATFTVGFGRDDDETPFAREVARRYGTDHHEIVVSDAVARDGVEDAIASWSEPYGDSSAIPTHAVCREVARHVKVVLTGDGGDELFAGYGRYRWVARIPHVPGAASLGPLFERAPIGRFRSKARRALLAVGSGGEARQRALIECFSLHERRRLLGHDARVFPDAGARGASLGARPSHAQDVDAALAFDLGVYLPDDLLVKVDIASMRFGLEARAPLLDHELAARVVPLAADQKQDAHEGKKVLQTLCADLLPGNILHRAKRGFGSPVEAWLSGPLRPMLEDLLRPSTARVREWLDGDAIDRVLDQVTVGKGNGHQGWTLLALEVWARRHAA